MLIFLIGICINEYVYGNLFSYLECKENLQKYLDNNYSNTKILDARYNFFNSPKYVFRVKHIEKKGIYKYTVYLSDKTMMIDGYQESIKLERNNKLNKELSKYVAENNINDLTIKGEYEEKTDIILTVEKKVSNDAYTLDDFAKSMAGIMKQLQQKYDNNIKKAKIILYLNNNYYSSIIYLDQEIDNMYKYILDSFETEYIDK